MIRVTDVHSLTDFLRNSKKHLQRLRKARRPALLTVNGKAAVVVQDAAAYEQLLERLERVEALEGIQRGIDAMKRGQTRPLGGVLDDLKAKYE
ncbi:MAG: type II toxin-antitoxin system Phd/YefM family antitoxin [Phycisphaerales bacterium]|nr:type II toxin-antitoxin system Phd/YefM family antitoxin [Phycisphaerales bacterium]